MRRRVIPAERWGLEPAPPSERRQSRIPARGLVLARTLALAALLLPIAAARPPARQPVDYTRYHNYTELTAELQRLVRAHADIARLEAIGESRGGRTIWAVEIAKSGGVAVAERPALLIAANLEGDQVIGSELALFTVEWLLTQYATNADVKRRVDEQAFLIVPRVNPDGAEAMFASPRTGQRTNSRPYDDDNDARTDEDPAEDLNGDGVITVMRVKDPAGRYRVHGSEPRLMVRADAAKGESGGWALYIEGTDNDRDGFYNEDGPGGVDPNRNFQHEYPYYAADAGPHMVSEPETRSLLDYVLARPGVAAILTYGGSDNLVNAPNTRGELASPAGVALTGFAEAGNAEARSVGTMQTGGGAGFGGMFRGGAPPAGTAAGTSGGRPSAGRRPATVVSTDDLEYFRTISEKYRKLTGIGRVASMRKPAGAFFEYGYYQYGVPSFSTPGWGIEKTAAPDSAAPAAGRPGAPRAGAPDSTAPAAGRPGAQRAGAPDSAAPSAPRPGPQRAGAGAPPVGQRPGGNTAGSASDDNDLRVLKWLDMQQIDGFANWSPITHPQLGEAEIGGFKPYAVSNPPAAEISQLGAQHAEFALYLATLFPHVRIASTKVTAHGGGVFRIEAEIENAGYLPTALAQGVTARAVHPVMLQLGVAPEAIITGAGKTSFVTVLAGSATRQKFQWVVRGQAGARVELKLRSEKGGSEAVTLTLR
jgi:hypothetical protein